jgi:signal peptidase I
MSMPLPPSSVSEAGLNRIAKMLVVVGAFGGICIAIPIALRIFGLLYPFYIPTASMAPAVSPGDHVIMEGLTFLNRKPHRGDIIVFNSDGISSLQLGTKYDKRILGEPGEHLRISDGKLYINDSLVVVTNCAGEISYPLTQQLESFGPKTDVIVPQGQYFVVGDNSTNSFDSRFWGCLPAKNIVGRILFCYWPPNRIGKVE